MRIEKIYMESFMGKKDFTLTLAPGDGVFLRLEAPAN